MKFLESATPYLLATLGLIASLLAWFYNLVEKRINARIEEIKDLQKQLAAIKEVRTKDLQDVAIIGTELKMIKEYQEKGFIELRSLIVDKMENLKELFQAQIKNK